MNKQDRLAESKIQQDALDKAVSKISAVNRLTHFSDIAKFLGCCENALKRLESDEETFLDAIMEEKLDGELFTMLKRDRKSVV